MRKAIINLDCSKFGHSQEFKTKEEWDADSYSPAGLRRRQLKGPANYVYRNEPLQFPCLAITTGLTIYQSDGPDEEEIFFFYDYKLEDE